MTDSFDDILKGFVADPTKDVFIVDEIRPSKGADQFAIYGLVVIKMETLVEAQAEWYSIATQPNFKDSISNDVKGRMLFGSGYRDELEPVRRFFEKWILRCSRFFFMYTSQENIKLNKKTASGKVRFSESDGTVTVAGAELQPLLGFFKEVANNLSIGPKKVEVVLDEAEQNSSGEIRAGSAKFTDFQTFNLVEGDKPAKVQCPTEFRIIRAPDQSPNFQHALLFPDALCYLANKHGLLIGKDFVDRDLFHIREIPLSAITKTLEVERSGRVTDQAKDDHSDGNQ